MKNSQLKKALESVIKDAAKESSEMLKTGDEKYAGTLIAINMIVMRLQGIIDMIEDDPIPMDLIGGGSLAPGEKP